MKKKKNKKNNKKQEAVEKVLHAPGGLMGRWMMTSLSFVVAILAIIMIIVSMGVSSYYYTNLRENLVNRSTSTAQFFQRYQSDTSEQFYSMAEQYVTDYNERDKLEVQFINSYGRIFLSTSGLTTDSIPGTEDVDLALENREMHVYSGEDELSSERVMSVTSPLVTDSGDLIGAVRYITSLSIAEKQIAILIGMSFLASVIFLALVVISNRNFITSIIEQIRKINEIASEIAAGRYGMRMKKVYDDELGALCDTINYMSDELSRAEITKNDFISSVSHELRTPLTAIGGWSETLIDCGGAEPEETKQGLEIIQKESKRLTQMVEELLDFSRIESGSMKLVVETFDAAIELYESTYMFENLLDTSGLKLEYAKDDGNYLVNGDRHRLKQVFLNVIDNAAKYGKSGGKISVHASRTDDVLCFVVRDWGVGIPENELPFVKDKFYKGSSKQRGSGIGLAVTDEIVKLHGGKLEIESWQGEGTRVSIRIPAAVPQEKQVGTVQLEVKMPEKAKELEIKDLDDSIVRAEFIIDKGLGYDDEIEENDIDV